jgi:hypothetical protein
MRRANPAFAVWLRMVSTTARLALRVVPSVQRAVVHQDAAMSLSS